MNRNSETQFSSAANLEIKRSKFTRPSEHKTTFNAGDLVPIYIDEMLPGDTFTMDSAAIIRMSTPIYPVMDNANADFYWFFVPNRLIWEHWQEMNGENNTTYWEQPTEYSAPQVTAPEGGWTKGTIADFLGVPTNIDNISISALPFRAYGKIWNDWFRDENLKQPINVPLDDTTTSGTNGNDYITDIAGGGAPAKVAKYNDYFTSCLPEPQKGPDILMPMGGNAPVWGTGKSLIFSDGTTAYGTYDKGIGSSSGIGIDTTAVEKDLGASVNDTANPRVGTVIGIIPKNDDTLSGLYADLASATGATINELREAFAIQHLYELDARGGTRYIELIKMHFGVTSPDARLQRSEYIGGQRVPINISQVVQTSQSATTPQGNVAAYSLTDNVDNAFTYSATEHGFVMGFVCVRTEHTYQQGLERFWSRKTRFDWYWPALANIGEQAVLNKEIYAQGTDADEEAFGYQEAWADYRYKPSRVSGCFRSNYAQSLDSWHYADYYTEQPTLSSLWIDETESNINRTLAVQSDLEDQFIADFYFKCDCYRPMPVYSIPGMNGFL